MGGKMRTGTSLLFAAATICAGCRMPVANQSTAAADDDLPTMVVISTAPGNCSATWNGSPASRDEISANSIQIIERAIADIGGPQNITEENLPSLRVEAADAVPWTCAGSMIAAAQRAGFAFVALKPSGSSQPFERAYFNLDVGAPPAPVEPTTDVIGIAPGGISWNDEPVDLAALTARTRQSAAGVPGEIVLAPSPDATFASVYQVVHAVRVGNGVATLPGCRSAGQRAAGSAAAAPAFSADC